MSEEFKNHRKIGSELLYLLSFTDSIDRLDTIILEIRHLQANIIYNLREPCFFLILKNEEKNIWLTKLEEKIKNLSVANDYKKLAEQFILSFPPYSNNNKNKEELKKPEKKIVNRLNEIRKTSLWNDDQHAIYHSLASLQLLKRDVFKDKLTLCKFSYESSIHRSYHSNKNTGLEKYIHSKAMFMIIRASIMSKVAFEYIDRLFEYRQQMEFFADLSSEAMPQSSIKRRREIELYSNFLAERTRTMRTDFSLLLYDLGFKSISGDDYLILHNWHHKYVSESRSYRISYDDIRPLYSTHIGSHFWTPERPDLQPIIAHEVAHMFIKDKDIFDNLKNYKLQSLDNGFSFLLRKIIKIITRYIDNYDDFLGSGYGDAQTLTKEIACDLLASSVKGQSFLYAHFLEYFGFHYSFSYLVKTLDGDNIDPELIYNAEFSLGDDYGSHEWYLRVLVVTTWVKSTWYKNKKNYLDNDLIEGIEKIADDILNYYIYIAVSDEDKKAMYLWKEMTGKICFLITSQKKLCKTVIKYKKKREKDEYSLGGKKFPKRMRRLNFRVRNALYLMQVWMKTKASRPLGDMSNNDLVNGFNIFYIGGNETQKIIIKDKYNTPPLYKYIHDIPWQCSLMRAKDMYWDMDKNKNINIKTNNFNSFMTDIVESFPLGRDLFSYALEFHLFTSDLPSDRLLLFKALIDHNKSNKPVKYVLKDIIGQNLINDIYHHAYVYKNDMSNVTIIEKKRRNHEKKSGLILKEIFNKLKNNIEKVIDNQDILSLYSFLSSKNNSTENNIEGSISIIRSSLLFYPPENNIEDSDCISNILNKNDVLYESYLITKLVLSAENKGNKNYYQSIKNISNIKENTWTFPKENKQSEEVTRYHKRLGRNDILAVSSTTSLCRCKIPEFNLKNNSIPLFISRRELAIPIRLGSKKWGYIDQKNPRKQPTPLAAISLSLKQPSLRLSFVYRLIESIKQKNSWSKIKGTHLECVGDRFSVENNDLRLNDCAFLTDGRDDILIIFSDTSIVPDKKIANSEKIKARNILKRVNSIFEIQDALYQDFMVDRTRLFFMPQALHIFKEKKARNNYKAIVKLRLKEDRTLDLSNEKVKLHNIKGLYKSPGQYDYEIDMDKYFEDGTCLKMLEIMSKEIFTAPYIDYTETQILKKWE